MKQLLAALVIALSVVGCATVEPPKTQIVYVDKPIPYVPKPPDVPPFVSEVDKLTDADVIDPGKVGQAYKYDMTQLRQLIKIYRAILDQYGASSQNFDQVSKDIDKLTQQIDAAPK